jgi:hypothetical protein
MNTELPALRIDAIGPAGFTAAINILLNTYMK